MSTEGINYHCLIYTVRVFSISHMYFYRSSAFSPVLSIFPLLKLQNCASFRFTREKLRIPMYLCISHHFQSQVTMSSVVPRIRIIQLLSVYSECFKQIIPTPHNMDYLYLYTHVKSVPC
uniref:Uncharacterized protein n=1 Tax=Cacopsylla melanoneura TaxID=428564 RepID=A0A8D8QUY3_9HEMI